jgi:hypothetical protein
MAVAAALALSGALAAQDENPNRPSPQAQDRDRDVPKEPMPSVPDGQATKQGLRADYFKMDAATDKDVPELTGRKADHSQVDDQIWFGKFDDDKNYAADGRGAKAFATGYNDRFAVCWDGFIRVAKDGVYKFYLTSDDGSKLWVHDKLVIDNGGRHAMDEDSGSIELKAGYHPIRVVYFENDEVEGCRLAWSYDGQDKQVVPSSAFFHGDMKKDGKEKPLR